MFSFYITDNQRDSASEPDDEEIEEEWLKTYDSARRCYYWQNFATNVITYDEPEEELAHEKNLVNTRIKVYWVVQVIEFIWFFFDVLLMCRLTPLLIPFPYALLRVRSGCYKFLSSFSFLPCRIAGTAARSPNTIAASVVTVWSMMTATTSGSICRTSATACKCSTKMASGPW